MPDTLVAPRPTQVPVSRHRADDRTGEGLTAAELIARLTASATPPPSGGRRACRAEAAAPEAPRTAAPEWPFAQPARNAQPARSTQPAPAPRQAPVSLFEPAPLTAPFAAVAPVADATPTEALPLTAPFSVQADIEADDEAPARRASASDAPPAGLTGSFFTRGLGREGGTGFLPAVAAAVRSPKAVAAAATVTVLGTTAVLAGLPTPGGQLAKSTDSPTMKLAAADATLPTQNASAPTSPTAPTGAGTAAVAPLQMGSLPQVFDQADAARIIAVQKAADEKAAADRANALRNAAAAAASGASVSNVINQVASSGVAAQALAAARTRLGMPYVYGAAGPGSFDCSGLVQWAYKQIGITLPRTADAQSMAGTPVSKANLQPGDLVFFYSPVSHVGIYIGNGQILHASQSGEPVKISDMSGMPFHNAVRVA